MSVKSKRNPYTLGGFANLPKRGASFTSLKEAEELRDPFEHDPFKVQSYNFRYAEPPGYNLQTPFCVQPLLNRKSDMQQSNFHDSRRRRFVQASNYNTTNPLHANYYQSNLTSGNYSSGGYSSSSHYYQRPFNYMGTVPTPPTDHGYVSSNHVFYRSPTTVGAQTTPPLVPTPIRPNVLRNKRSSLSLCEIQIKINRSEHTLSPDNVVINIATDKSGTISATTPYKTEGLTINSMPYKPTGSIGQQQSKSSLSYARPTVRRQSCQSLHRSRCCSTSSDSSSDFDTPSKKSLERVPQFIALKEEEKKTTTRARAREPFKASIPFVTPPWVLGTKSPKDNNKNMLTICKSNQTILDNLDTQKTKSKFNMTRKTSSVSLSFKSSVTSITKNSKVTVNSNRTRATSTVRTSKNSDQNPLRVNINLYRDKKLGLRV